MSTIQPEERKPTITKLYIGNLDETIDEYAIVKLFESYGKITGIEMKAHWVGPKKGLSKGYCFLEYEKKSQSLAAINALHGKIIRGRNLVVSFAHKTPEQDEIAKRGQASGRPNSLSILRSSKMKHTTTDAKILAIERKLKLLKQSSSTTTTTTTSSTTPSSSQHTSRNTSKNRYKPY